METIRQSCPQCQSVLELPASAVGRMARCPACQQTFRVPPPEAPAASQAPLAETQPGGWSPEAGSAGAPTAPQKSGYAGGYSPDKESANPYALSAGMATHEGFTVQRGDLTIQRAQIDQIFSHAWSIFSARWQPLVLAGLIYFVISFLFGMINAGVGFAFGVAEMGAGVGMMGTAMAAVQLVVGIVTWYLMLGLMSVALKVARGEPAAPSDIFVSPALFGAALVILIPLLLIGSGSQFAVVMIQENVQDDAMMFATVGLSIGLALVQALILLLIWPTFYLAADGRASNLKALSLGFQIGSANIINSFLLALFAMVLGIAAVFTCGFGAIVTQPLMVLYGAVAYLLMTGQPISDPATTPQISPQYGGPQGPTF